MGLRNKATLFYYTQVIKNKLEHTINQFVEKQFPQFYVVEYSIENGENKLIELSIEKDGGIKLDDCMLINKALRKYLEEEKYPQFADYELNVCSPGLGKPLKLHRQYQNHIGKQLNITLLDGQNITGNLTQLENEQLTLTIKTQNKHTHKVTTSTQTIPFMQIQETKVEVSF